MQNIIFGDILNQDYKYSYKISEEILREVFESPSRIQKLNNEITLYLKEFLQDKLSHLMLCTQIISNKTLFSFALWIPNELISKEIELLETLKIFANKFGCKVKISDKESYFIEKELKLLQEPLTHPYQLVEILGSENIPCKLHLSDHHEVKANINWVHCYYCFAVNENKYFTWLHGIDTVNIKVQKNWYNYFLEIREILDPFGRTTLQILKPRAIDVAKSTNVEMPNKTPKEEVDFEIPKIYKNQFNRINQLVSTLENNQKMMVIPKSEKNRCIFCDANDTTQEHIFAKWFRDIFEEKIFDYSINIKRDDETFFESLNSQIDIPKSSSYGLTSHNVCLSCNTGWMSQLEEKAKAILLDNSGRLKRTLRDLNLNNENQIMLSTWLTAKAALLLIKGYLATNNTSSFYYDLKDNKIPTGFLVEISEVTNYDLNFIIHKGISDNRRIVSLKVMNKNTAQEVAKNLFVVCIQIGNFIFRVSYLDESKGLMRIAFIKRTTVIYPVNFNLPYKYITGEENKWNEVEGDFQLRLFSLGLGLYQQ